MPHSSTLQKDLQNLEDAADELLMQDGDDPIPYPFVNKILCNYFIV